MKTIVPTRDSIWNNTLSFANLKVGDNFSQVVGHIRGLSSLMRTVEEVWELDHDDAIVIAVIPIPMRKVSAKRAVKLTTGAAFDYKPNAWVTPIEIQD